MVGRTTLPHGRATNDDGLLSIIEAMSGNAAKIVEGIPVLSDQGVEVPMHRKIDVLSAGEGQDVGKAEHHGLAGPGEGNGVRAPVHLPLGSGLGLEADDRGRLGLRPHGAKAVAQDGDAPLVALLPHFFKEALARDVGKLGEKSPDPIHMRVQLARPGKR